MAAQKETTFLKLIVVAERRILGYLVSLLPTVQDAEDLLQETTIVMWEKFDEFLATQDGDPDMSRFVAWGNKIAFYKVLNTRRDQRRKLKLFSDELLEVVSEEWTRQEESGELENRRKVLACCIEDLPSDRREVLRAYYWKRTAIDQIASELKRTTASVYKTLQRTRQALHRFIESKICL